MDHTPAPARPRQRRRGIAAAAILALTAALPVATSATASADASPGRHQQQGQHAPSAVSLPDGFRPEGITSGPGSTYYAGSVSNGRIVTGDLRKGTSRELLAPAAGRSLRGLFFDHRSRLLWAVGSVGTEAHVWALDARSGAVESDIKVPDGKFLNDLVVTRSAVWVTDSQMDRLARIALGRGGHPTSAPPTILALTGAWPADSSGGFNANGIRTLPDGTLVMNNSRVGGLWQVSPRTGVVTQIPISGSPAIVSGDGLERSGRTLYNVRGNGANAVSVIRLHRDRGRWSATSVATLTDPSLDVPSTATLVGRTLWAVNARFGVASPDTATYSITPLRVRR